MYLPLGLVSDIEEPAKVFLLLCFVSKEMSIPTEVTYLDNLRRQLNCTLTLVCVLTSHSKIRMLVRSPTDLLTLSLQSCWVLARSQSKFVLTLKMPDTEAQEMQQRVVFTGAERRC